MEREKAFNAGLIGPGGIIAPSEGMIELVSHPEELEGSGHNTDEVQQSRDIDLNMPILEVVEEGSVRLPEEYDGGGGVEQGLLSQDLDPVNLLLIIEAVSRERTKRAREGV